MAENALEVTLASIADRETAEHETEELLQGAEDGLASLQERERELMIRKQEETGPR